MLITILDKYTNQITIPNLINNFCGETAFVIALYIQ